MSSFNQWILLKKMVIVNNANNIIEAVIISERTSCIYQGDTFECLIVNSAKHIIIQIILFNINILILYLKI